jgi:hypothetical protein
MPGFRVGQYGGNNGTYGVSKSEKFRYTYTWEIDELLGQTPGLASNKALIYARDISLPAFNVSIERHIGSSLEYKFAKSVSYDDIKITFYDTDKLYEKISEWRKSVYNWNDGIRTASEYKKKSVIKVYDPTFDDVDAYSYELVGSWPSVIRHGDLTYTSSDVKIVEVTLTYDFAYVKEPGQDAIV